MMDKKGFTLVELLVVMIILGTLLAIAGISAKAWLDKYRVESQMKMMLVDLSNARARSMNKLRTHFVVLTSTGYVIYEDTNPGPDGDDDLNVAADQLVMQKHLDDAMTISGGTLTLGFDSRGLVTHGLSGTQTNLRVTDSLGATANCIAVSATRIRIGGWDGSTCAVQ